MIKQHVLYEKSAWRLLLWGPFIGVETYLYENISKEDFLLYECARENPFIQSNLPHIKLMRLSQKEF